MIKIFTDSSSDIPKGVLDKYKIDVLPIGIMQDEKEYTIGQDIDSNLLIEKMKEGQDFKTSQVTRALIYFNIEKYIKEGYQVIYLPLSSGISGTYNNALGAKEDLLKVYPNAQIEIVDSKSATYGHGIVTIKAAILAEKGYGIKEIITKLNDIIENQIHLFTVNDLEYLFRGGRLSKSSKIIGGLLNILPILYIERKEGKIISIDKARGKKAFLNKVKQQANKLSKTGTFNSNQSVVIAHADWEEMAEDTKEFFINDLGVKRENVHIRELGCIITAHTGPGTLTIFFSSDPGELNTFDI